MRKRIVIIDDDAAVRNSLRKLLQDFGYEVVVAADSQDGRRKLSQHEFDLLILDLNLPKISGAEILDSAMQCQPGLPILVLTNYAESYEPGGRAGVAALLEKPPDVRILLSTVEKLLSGPLQSQCQGAIDSPCSAESIASMDSNFVGLEDPGRTTRTNAL